MSYLCSALMIYASVLVKDVSPIIYVCVLMDTLTDICCLTYGKKKKKLIYSTRDF